MNCYLKMELTRAFGNKRMILAVSLGIGLSIWHYTAYIFPLRDYEIGRASCRERV